jgi:hypothetical protein
MMIKPGVQEVGRTILDADCQGARVCGAGFSMCEVLGALGLAWRQGLKRIHHL